MTDAKDLVCLVADKDIEFTIKGVFERHESLGIRKFSYDIFSHVEHDPGCYNHGHEYIRNFLSSYKFAIIVFDLLGCGHDDRSREDVENFVENNLRISGWGNRAVAIVIKPELENWLWSQSPHVDEVLGWSGRQPSLRDWLADEGYILDIRQKPQRPKEAFNRALRVVNKPRSASLCHEIARKVSLARCKDPSFIKLRSTIKRWFPFI